MVLSLPALAKTFVLAQLSVCQPTGSVPHVDLYFNADKPEYVTEAPMSALTAEMRGNPDSTFATDSRWMAGGLTFGKIADGGFGVTFHTLSDQAGNTCLEVDTVKIGIRYEPTIFIANEISKKDCRYRMVKLHEERHVATDLTTIEEYIPKIKMDILWYLRSLGPQGPYQGADIQKHAHDISGEVSKAAEPMVKKLVEVRRARQGSIDTPENYKQESALCPDEAFPMPAPAAK